MDGFQSHVMGAVLERFLASVLMRPFDKSEHSSRMGRATDANPTAPLMRQRECDYNTPPQETSRAHSSHHFGFATQP